MEILVFHLNAIIICRYLFEKYSTGVIDIIVRLCVRHAHTNTHIDTAINAKVILEGVKQIQFFTFTEHRYIRNRCSDTSRVRSVLFG